MRLRGKVGVVTGASSGIGRAVAVALAREEVTVVAVARRRDKLSATVELARATAPDSLALPCDVSDRAAVERAFCDVRECFGRVDLLVNNAGVGCYRPFADTSAEDFERLMRTNYFGTVYWTKAVLPGMIERGDGAIVGIGSVSGRVGTAGFTAYTASKFAQVGFTESLAHELRGRGIHVVQIFPGPIETEFIDGFDERPPGVSRPWPAEDVARATVECLRRDKLERTVPRVMGAVSRFRVLCPPLFRAALSRVAPPR